MGRLTRESESGGLTLSYTYDPAGNRTSMTASGTESYTINYSYDANNRLTRSVYADGTHASTYTYDAAGNLLTAQEWKPQEGIASTASYSYNNLNQLASQTVNGRSSSFAYNADGIRTAKTVGRRLVGYLLDGGNVIGETEGGELVATYQRGVNLISCIDPRDTNFEETYYLYNAHGDVVQLVDEGGNLTKTYEYDAFGNEKNRTSDPNPFRYCGEYYDAESGSYYLRARYYNPAVGRFTQEDTHWNTGNMIYGDEPQQIGEYKDPLGVSRCTYAPQTAAIMQAGNLYAYGMGNPIKYVDPTGKAEVLKFEDDRVTSIGGGAESLWLLEAILGLFAGLLGLKAMETAAEAVDKQHVENITFKSRSSYINWDVDENTKHHILEGSKGSHREGWEKFGIDPDDPSSFGRLLPFLKEAVDKGIEKSVDWVKNGKVINYVYYIKEKAFWIWVRIFEATDGTRVLSDAAEYVHK